MITKFKTDKDLVGYVLANYPVTRNSDIELLLTVWEMQGLYLAHDQKQMFRDGSLSNAESLRRLRQKYQEQGLYRATESVRAKRRSHENAVHDSITKVRLADMKQASMWELMG